MVLWVAGFAGGGTPGHLLMGGGVFREKTYFPGNYNSAVEKPNITQPDPKFCQEVKETLKARFI